MKPVIKWTLYQRRISIIWWSAAAFFLIFINMIFYPTFKDQAAELQKSFASIPESTLQFIGGSADFFSPVGFLNSQIFFLMLPLLLGVLAIGLGSSLLAREEQDRTIESLLSRPISRSKFLMAKVVAGCAILAFVTLAALATTLITARVVDISVSAGSMLLATFACFLLVLSFGAVAFLLSATGKARAASVGVATFIALGGYVINSLAGTVDWLKIPAKVFPFHYYDSEAILNGSFSWANAAFFTVIIVGAGLLSWLAFRRRDIH